MVEQDVTEASHGELVLLRKLLNSVGGSLTRTRNSFSAAFVAAISSVPPHRLMQLLSAFRTTYPGHSAQIVM
jgi:hypothetical protein